jgi:phosphoglycerate dehydrogenase-like enzyme
MKAIYTMPAIKGEIAGAAFDVAVNEPPDNSELIMS